LKWRGYCEGKGRGGPQENRGTCDSMNSSRRQMMVRETQWPEITDRYTACCNTHLIPFACNWIKQTGLGRTRQVILLGFLHIWNVELYLNNILMLKITFAKNLRKH
jgi:hypothetical protein